ncbi:NADP-dependent oxidoreductase domain-containing protein [Gloeopeniophorella convolvens]|nr:NADP-dependent oxidoreductase domain-containing protein [Gloeopeniophorella convolvens]
MSATLEYDPKDMPFRRLGPSGLRVPVFSLGGWLTFGGTVVGDPVKDIIKTAIENGINMFDEAEAYAGGKSESELGRVIKELGVRRSDLILTTKIFWGTRPGPNNMGLSRKHIIEGLKESLRRLQTDYVDVVFAHRPDHTVPVEETVRAFSWVIDQGLVKQQSTYLAYYWGTSEWSAREIEEAIQIAQKYGLHSPIAEQCEHHLLKRERPEGEYRPLYKKYGLSTTVFSALASGLLTGKYNNGIPEGSRFDTNSTFFAQRIKFLESEDGKSQIEIVKTLSEFAEKELDCSITHLALAWVAKNPNTGTVILGATRPEQVLTPEVLKKIDEIVKNKPDDPPSFGRPALDIYGRI